MEVEFVNPATLKPAPYNPRRIDEDALRRLAKLLDVHGFVDPIIARRGDNLVIGGHQRLKANALREKPAETVPVIFLDGISDSKAKALNIALNNVKAQGEFDIPKLADLLQDIDVGEFDVSDFTAFSEADIAGMMHGLDEFQATEDEAPAVEDDAVSKTGDLWLMGDHRLLCGDSTKAEDVSGLMAGAKAGLCFTSPPYGQQRDYTEASDCSDWDKLMQGAFGNLPMSGDGQVLVNLGLIHRECEWQPYWDGWIEWMRDQGWRRFGWYVWDQGPGLPGDWNGRLAPAFEFVFHFNRESIRPSKAIPCKHAGIVREGGMRRKDGTCGEWTATVQSHRIPDAVCRISREKASQLVGHPAMFSVGFAAYFVSAWQAAIFDPFSGSGTTIIACEQLKRKCYAIEIEPRYVDVAVKRWQNFTGKNAVLDSDGRTFTKIAQSRQ